MERYKARISDNYPYGGYVDLEEKVLLYITENPGCFQIHIVHAVEANPGTVAKSIDKLILDNKIKFERDGVIKRYYLVE